MEPTTDGVSPSGKQEEQPDADPDDNESDENPEQERRFADRKPWELLALQEEARPPGCTLKVELEDLARDCLGRVGRDTPFGIAVDGRRENARLSGLPRHHERVPAARNRNTRAPWQEGGR